jgi:hypothetical protein
MSKQPTNINLPRMIEIQAGKGSRTEIEPSIRMAIASMRQQIASLYAALAQQSADAGGASDTGHYATINNTVIQMTNNSGADRENGDVVILDVAADESFDVTTTAGDPRVVGVVWSDSPDGSAPAILDGEIGAVCIAGLASVNADATATAIAAGDFLRTHTTPGIAARAPHVDDEGVFAVALEDLAAGTGPIYAAILPMPHYEIFKIETLTADNASQVTLSEAAYADVDGAYVFIFDTVSMLMTFPDWLGVFYSNHSRCVLTAAGAVVTNPLADFDTGAGSLRAIYLRPVNASEQNIGIFKNTLATWIMMASFSGTLTGPYPFTDFNTYFKSIEGAINDIRNALWTENIAQDPANYKEIGYDLDGSITGLSGLMLSCGTWVTSAMTTAIFHQMLTYSNCVSNIFLISSITTAMYENAAGGRTISEALEYSGDLIDKITRAVARF